MFFAAHGAVGFTRQEQVLIVDVQGPWNLELIDLYKEKMRPYVQDLSANGAWGLIIEIHGEASCPMDALEGIRLGVIDQAANWHRVCTAYVIAPEVRGYRLMDRLWRGIYRDVMPCEIFERRGDALAWIQNTLQVQP